MPKKLLKWFTEPTYPLTVNVQLTCHPMTTPKQIGWFKQLYTLGIVNSLFVVSVSNLNCVYFYVYNPSCLNQPIYGVTAIQLTHMTTKTR